jgi:hypothetical protein
MIRMGCNAIRMCADMTTRVSNGKLVLKETKCIYVHHIVLKSAASREIIVCRWVIFLYYLPFLKFKKILMFFLVLHRAK